MSTLVRADLIVPGDIVEWPNPAGDKQIDVVTSVAINQENKVRIFFALGGVYKHVDRHEGEQIKRVGKIGDQHHDRG